MSLEDITQSEISRSQKAKYCTIPLTRGAQSDSQRQKVGWWVLGEEEWGVSV